MDKTVMAEARSIFLAIFHREYHPWQRLTRESMFNSFRPVNLRQEKASLLMPSEIRAL